MVMCYLHFFYRLKSTARIYGTWFLYRGKTVHQQQQRQQLKRYLHDKTKQWRTVDVSFLTADWDATPG